MQRARGSADFNASCRSVTVIILPGTPVRHRVNPVPAHGRSVRYASVTFDSLHPRQTNFALWIGRREHGENPALYDKPFMNKVSCVDHEYVALPPTSLEVGLEFLRVVNNRSSRTWVEPVRSRDHARSAR